MDSRFAVAGGLALAAGLVVWGAVALASGSKSGGWTNDTARVVKPGHRYRFIIRQGKTVDDVLATSLVNAGWGSATWTRNQTPGDWPVPQTDPTGAYLYVDAIWNGDATTLPPDQYISLWEET